MKISCIDIGGTYIKSGVLEDGVLTDVEETPTDGGGGRGRCPRGAVYEADAGRGACGRLHRRRGGRPDGRSALSDNIPGYTGLNPRASGGGAGLPVAVENDVNAGGSGESPSARRGTNRIFLMVSYGTGVWAVWCIPAAGCTVTARGQRGGVRGLVTHPEAVDPARQGTGATSAAPAPSALVARVTALYPALTTDGIFLHI